MILKLEEFVVTWIFGGLAFEYLWNSKYQSTRSIKTLFNHSLFLLSFFFYGDYFYIKKGSTTTIE